MTILQIRSLIAVHPRRTLLQRNGKGKIGEKCRRKRREGKSRYETGSRYEDELKGVRRQMLVKKVELVVNAVNGEPRRIEPDGRTEILEISILLCPQGGGRGPGLRSIPETGSYDREKLKFLGGKNAGVYALR
ncbi:hypothetical protein KM043_007074 [Ampulex compressa]|nr:hypothetical protein KM043_007074 [Ampulex compressa]